MKTHFDIDPYNEEIWDNLEEENEIDDFDEYLPHSGFVYDCTFDGGGSTHGSQGISGHSGSNGIIGERFVGYKKIKNYDFHKKKSYIKSKYIKR